MNFKIGYEKSYKRIYINKLYIHFTFKNLKIYELAQEKLYFKKYFLLVKN